MRRLATPLLLLLLPVAAFLALFHPATLDIGNPGWLIRGSDNGENALGLHAYRYDPHAGASLHIATLNAPEGVPVLYLDANPLVTLAAKPFAALLPADAQFVGPFVLFSLLLQVLFAWLLLRPHAPHPLALWAGVFLLAFPPTLANRFVHMNLMAHWTILEALWLFLDPVRSRKLAWWAGLIAVTALIHSYLLVMVGAIWASTMLVRFTEGPSRDRTVAAGQSAVILVMVGLLAWWLGVFGDQVPAGNFGAFAMPIDALWNPALDHFSLFLPGSERSPGRGFEGFQYLGVGGLILVIGAVLIARRRPARPSEAAAGQRLRGLVPALLVLTLLAIVQLPLPPSALAVLDPLRASGRMFWPVGYVLVFMAVLAWFRLSPERAGLALLGLVAIQLIDISGMIHAVRAQSAAAGEHRLYARTPDPRWDRLIAQSRDIAFIPGDVTRNLAVFQEIAWRAVKAGRPVRSAYAARNSLATERRLMAERSAFDRAELVPGRLYILLAGAPLPAAVTPRMVTLDNITVIAPSSPR